MFVPSHPQSTIDLCTVEIGLLIIYFSCILQAKLLESSHGWLGASTSTLAGKYPLAEHPHQLVIVYCSNRVIKETLQRCHRPRVKPLRGTFFKDLLFVSAQGTGHTEHDKNDYSLYFLYW